MTMEPSSGGDRPSSPPTADAAKRSPMRRNPFSWDCVRTRRIRPLPPSPSRSDDTITNTPPPKAADDDTSSGAGSRHASNAIPLLDGAESIPAEMAGAHDPHEPRSKASKFSSTAHRRKLMEDSSNEDGGSDTRRPDEMFGSGQLRHHLHHGFGGGPSRQPSPRLISLRRRSSRANMLLAAHPISDPILDITVGSAHNDAGDDDNDDVSTVVGDYDLVLHGNAGVFVSTIKSLFRGRKRIILLVLFLATMAKKRQQNGAGHRKSSVPNRRVLGSAMIGSITDALSPILPFAGGVDLRRGEHWGLDDDYNISSSQWSGWFWPESTDSAPASTGSKRKSTLLGTRSRFLADDGGGADARSTTKQKRPRTIPTASRDPVIAAPDPFVATDEIAKLTLEDIAVLFQYAVQATQDGFDKKSFMEDDNVSGRMAEVILALDQSVATSRGDGIVPALTRPSTDGTDDKPNDLGDVDALMFGGTMRILAEWRVLRQVPDGYKGYAVGMSLGHKDVVQNLVKIEVAIHDLIELRKQDYQDMRDEIENAWDEASCQSDGDANEPTCEAVRSDYPNQSSTPPTLRSPTLRELLQYEIDEGIQNVEKLPRLKEKSAGMGLLWVRRQLVYQTEVFANVLLVPSQYDSVTDAVAAAYSTVYDQFHGWAVQKIFNYSFQAAPDADLIFRHMNPSKLHEVTAAAMNGDIGDADDDIKALLTSSSGDMIGEVSVDEDEDLLVYDEELNQTPFYQLPMLNQSTYVEDWAASAAADESGDYQEDNEDANPWIRFGLHVASEWDKMGKHVVSEWDKLSSHVESEMDKFGKHVEEEWDKVASNIIQLFQGGDTPNGRAANSFTRDGALSGEALELYIGRKMEKDAKDHISIYLEVVSPLLEDIAGLFEEMNCDDLTKV